MPLILIVADDLHQCEYLEAQLTKGTYQIYTADSSEGALDILRQETIDLVILDAMSTIVTRLNMVNKICTQFFTPILMLLAKEDEASRAEYFEAGADQCLPRSFCTTELLSCVKALLRRADLERVRYQHLNRTRSIESKISLIPFTPTESKLINYLISRKNEAISKKELQTNVLRNDFSMLDRNLDMHFSNIRRKLAQSGFSKNVILTVRNKGFVFEG